ncbi:MAG TPA: pyridine nucleotide-disulfide oxidoreductase, partial [Actinopolymorphaceae bacterium]|nr:pyridine nucleotide-disulfide oxidoreductase [Actinopolymorphaceae bacterium]
LPVDPVLGTLEFLLDADTDTELAVELHTTGNPQNYVPGERLTTVTARVPAGQKQWVEVALDWTPEHARNAFVVLLENPHVALHHSDSAEPGTLFFRHRTPPPEEKYTEQWREWKQTLHRQSLCVRLGAATEAFDARHVIGGYARPYGGPQLWVSEPLEWDERPWVELCWDAPATFGEVAVIFDDEVEEDLINLHHHRTPYDVMPGLVRDYTIEAEVDDSWTTIASERDNRRRHRVHRLDQAVTATRLRVVVESTNGAPRAHVVAVRAYAQPR